MPNVRGTGNVASTTTPEKQGRSDRDRVVIIVVANLAGLISSGIICECAIKEYLTYTNVIVPLHLAHLLMLVYFVLIATRWSILRFICNIPRCIIFGVKLLLNIIDGFKSDDAESSSKPVFCGALSDKVNPLQFPWALRVGVAANFFYLGTLIVFTGGIVQSPFSSYGVAMIILGQFIAEFKQSDNALLTWGLIFYVLVGITSHLSSEYFLSYCVDSPQVGTVTSVVRGQYPANKISVTIAVFSVIVVTLLIGSFTGRYKQGRMRSK